MSKKQIKDEIDRLKVETEQLRKILNLIISKL